MYLPSLVTIYDMQENTAALFYYPEIEGGWELDPLQRILHVAIRLAMGRAVWLYDIVHERVKLASKCVLYKV